MPPKKPVKKAVTKPSPGKSSKAKNGGAGAKAKAGASGGTVTAAAKTSTAAVPVKTVTEVEKKEVGVTINLKDIVSVVLDDEGGKIKESGRPPLVIDSTGNVATFLRYRNVNELNALSTHDMQAEVLRKALLGAIRYGKPMAIDMMEADVFSTITEKFDEIYKGLMDDVLSKDIIQGEKYKCLVKDTDGDEYKKSHDFCDDLMLSFQFILITKNEPGEAVINKFYPVRVIP